MSTVVDMSNADVKAIRYKFVFVIENEVAMAITIPAHEFQTKQAECLRNNPEITEVEPNDGDMAKFNFSNDGIVNYVVDLPTGPVFERYAACFRSNPAIIEVADSSPVRTGWKYNGSDFYV